MSPKAVSREPLPVLVNGMQYRMHHTCTSKAAIKSAVGADGAARARGYYMRSAVPGPSGLCFPVLSQGAQGATATGRPLKDFKLNTQDCTLQGFNQVLFLPYRFEPSCECGLCLLLAQETCAFLTSARIKCVAAAAAAEAAAEAAA